MNNRSIKLPTPSTRSDNIKTCDSTLFGGDHHVGAKAPPHDDEGENEKKYFV